MAGGQGRQWRGRSVGHTADRSAAHSASHTAGRSVDHTASRSPRVAPPGFAAARFAAAFFTIAAVLLLAACGTPTQSGDCDQLLGEERYQRVLDVCGSPFHRASAHLGLAGLNMFSIINSTESAGSVVSLLDIDTGNITEKRERLVLAVEEVRSPGTGSEAFALLIAAYLGLAVTMEEFLDNGSGGATALDEDITSGEVSAATGLATSGVTSLSAEADATTPYYHIHSSGTAYNLTCIGDATSPICDDGGNEGAVYDDDDPTGSGRLDTGTPGAVSADEATVIAGLGTADPANLVVMLNSLDYPVSVDDSKAAELTNFLSEGDPDGTFTIGVTGFLNLIDVAIAKLTGSESGEIEGLSDEVNAVRAKIDNGGVCLAEQDATAAALMDLWYEIYLAAPGTAAAPLPDLSDYTDYNIVGYDSFNAADVTVYPGNVDPTDYGFADNLGMKFLYPISIPAATFDISNATAHMSEADADYQDEFENIPQLAPGAATAEDGEITFLEVLCMGG